MTRGDLLKLYLSLFVSFILGTTLVAKVNVIQLSTESNIIDLAKQESIRQSLNDLFSGKQDRIDYVTPSEARRYLSDYVKQKYGKEEGQRLIKQFFNTRYFGEKEEQKIERSPQEIAKRDPYLLTHISNMLQYGTPGEEETMEEAKKRWYPETMFLTPKDVFDACVNSMWCGNRLSVKDFEEYKKQFPDKVEAIFSTKYFMPENPEELRNYFLNNSFGFFTQSLVKNIYETAKRIMKATKQGDYIVIFGNTPYFVGRTLQKLISQNPNHPNYRIIIEFPFSGSPNRKRAWNFPDLRDFATQDRLNHLKKRLETVGLNPQNRQLQNHAVYFIDVVASGGGLAYLIGELLRDFRKADIPIPNFNIITLNKINITNQEDTRNSLIANQNAGDGERVTLFFPDKQNPHFSIDAQVIHLEGHTLLDQLPSNDWRIFAENNAAYWLPQYDYRLKSPKTKFIKTLLEFFDINLEYLIRNDPTKKAPI